MSIGQLEKILSCPNLPTPPAVALRVLEKSRDPGVSLDEIARLVESDLGLASRVLRTVNSSFYGLPQPCGSLSRALNLLGLKTVKLLVLGFSVVDMTPRAQCQVGFDFQRYWRRTFCCAAGAKQIATLVGATNPDEAMTAGLFQDMGVIALWSTMEDEYAEIYAGHEDDHSQLSNWERRLLGFCHAELGAALAKKWRLPDEAVAAIEFHHAPDRCTATHRGMVRTVVLGQIAANTIISQAPANHLVDLKRRAREWFGLEDEEIENLLDRITDAARELAQLFNRHIDQLPSASEILARANEQLVAEQLATHQESAQLKRQSDRLKQAVLTDPLTQVGNRKHFDELAKHCFEQAAREQTPLAVLMVDADHFKAVNDQFGHQAGDAVLVELARRLKRTVGEQGFVCRYGGEEFAVLVSNMDHQQAGEMAQRCTRVMRETPFDISGGSNGQSPLNVTVSIGVASISPAEIGQGMKMQTLIKRADQALYQAKDQGRNRVCIAAEEQHDAPLSEADVVEVNPNDREKKKVSTGSILIVDPDPLAAKLLQMLFAEKSDASPMIAFSAAQAADQLAAVPSDAPAPLIITEAQLPEGSVASFIQTVRQTSQGSQAVIWVVAASYQPAVSRACLEAGADHVCSKSEIVTGLGRWVMCVWQSRQQPCVSRQTES